MPPTADFTGGQGWDGAGAPVAPTGDAWPSDGILRCDWCKAPLRKRQARFCSRACSNRWYDLNAPRIASAVVGHPRAGTIKALILGALSDGEWHSAHELAVACKADSHSVKARISSLKASGHRIETDLPNGNCVRPHRYRLEVE